MLPSLGGLSPGCQSACLDESGGVCRLVMNKETQQPKGTAFVEYWDTTAAQAAAAACQKARYCLTATLAFY